MASQDTINVNEENFEYEVISYSVNIPVVVEFWAEWCKPCKVLGPLLEKLIGDADGAFRLARVNVDESPNLALQFGVRGIPAVKAFSQGEVVSQFSGVLPEARLREFLQKITLPGPLALALEKASSLLADFRWKEALALYQDLTDRIDQDDEARLGLAKAHLGLGHGAEALEILTAFPDSRLYASARQLRPYAEALTAYQAGRMPTADNELDSAFHNSLRVASRGNLLAAIDGLLDILRQNKRYRSGMAHNVVLSLIELLGEDSQQARSYRAELAAILF